MEKKKKKIVEVILDGGEELGNLHYLVKIEREKFGEFKEELLKELKKTCDEFDAYETIVKVAEKYGGKLITPCDAIYVGYNEWGECEE